MSILDKVNAWREKDADKKVVGEFYEKLAISKQFKANYHHKWNRYIRMYRGEQWDSKRPSWRVSSVNNISFALIESMIPLMTDKEPTVLVEPQSDNDVDVAQKLNLVLGNLWYSLKMNAKYVRVVRDALMFGTGVLKLGWDSNALGGMGEVRCDVVDPFDLFVDVNATSFDTAEYVIYRTKVPLRIIRRDFKKGKSVPSDFEYYNDDSSRDTPAKNERRDNNVATMYEEWARTDEGMRVRIFAGGVLLEEKVQPFEHDAFPFVVFHNYNMTSEFWGLSEFANIEALQKENNKVRSLIVENLQTTANNVWVIDSSAGIEKNTVTSRPGQVIVKNPAGRIERLQGASLPNGLFEQLNNIQSSMEYTTGIHPIVQGVGPGSVTAAASLNILTENAQTRVRGKLRSMEEGLTELGNWFIALIRQFYTEPRIIRLTRDDGFQFESFDASNLRQDEVNPQTGQVDATYLTQFDIRVIPGSSMRINKSARYQQAMEMYNAGALDPETLIEISEIADKEKIIERMIKHGRMADPNDPQAKIDKMIKAITNKIKFNVSSTDPFIVDSALREMMTNVQAVQEQTGIPNPTSPQGAAIADTLGMSDPMAAQPSQGMPQGVNPQTDSPLPEQQQ